MTDANPSNPSGRPARRGHAAPVGRILVGGASATAAFGLIAVMGLQAPEQPTGEAVSASEAMAQPTSVGPALEVPGSQPVQVIVRRRYVVSETPRPATATPPVTRRSPAVSAPRPATPVPPPAQAPSASSPTPQPTQRPTPAPAPARSRAS